MKQGDIVILPFSFTNLESSKLHPAMIIANRQCNQKKNILVIAISTNQGVSEYAEPLLAKNLDEGVLKKESFLRFHNIFAGEKRIILKKVAKLNEKKLREVLQRFQSYL